MAQKPSRESLEGRTWTIYGMIDPRDYRLFYIGMTTVDFHTRLSGHKNDSASAANRRCRELAEFKLTPIFVALTTKPSLREARKAERDLILAMPWLDNREAHPYGCQCEHHQKFRSYSFNRII